MEIGEERKGLSQRKLQRQTVTTEKDKTAQRWAGTWKKSSSRHLSLCVFWRWLEELFLGPYRHRFFFQNNKRFPLATPTCPTSTACATRLLIHVLDAGFLGRQWRLQNAFREDAQYYLHPSGHAGCLSQILLHCKCTPERYLLPKQPVKAVCFQVHQPLWLCPQLKKEASYYLKTKSDFIYKLLIWNMV